MRLPIVSFVLLVVIALGGAVAMAAQKSKNNKNAQERKDDAKVQSARQDVNEAEKRIQSDLKEYRAAEAETKKSLEAIASVRKAMEETSGRLERWISQNLGIPEAIEAQRAAQSAYDDAAKPLMAAMRTNPKYMPAIERAEKADKTLKALASDTAVEAAARKQQQAQASKDLSDWRYTLNAYLESASELKYPREKLVAAQTKLADLRAQLKKQLEMHPDLKAAEKKWEQAKTENEKDLQRLAALKRKATSDQSKLIAEKAQLAKAAMQDKQNDMKKKNQKKNQNNNKKNN